MSWIALIDQEEGRFDPTGLASQTEDLLPDLRCGTLMLEADLQAGDDACELMRLTGADLFMDTRQNVRLRVGADEVRLPAMDGPNLRLSYAWDHARGQAILGLEQGVAGLRAIKAPLPFEMDLDDIRLSMQRQAERPRDAITYTAISSDIEPFGPYPTLMKQTRVLGPDGPVAVSRLKRGDLVRSDRGELVPVLHLITRKLPARGRFAPIRLSAPAFGLTEDVFVAADQMLILRGPDIEYSFGCETVLMPARHLLSTPYARLASCGSVVSFYQVVLPRNEGLVIGDVALASLNIGRIRRKPEHLALSSLHQIDRKLLPEHAAAPFPVLKSAETLALMDLRAA